MVEKNREYVVDILDMTHDGFGVAKIDGFAVFIEGAITDEHVKIKIVKANVLDYLICVFYNKIDNMCGLSDDSLHGRLLEKRK